MRKFRIRGKRLFNETHLAYTFLTAGYDGKFFIIVKDQTITCIRYVHFVNEVHHEDWCLMYVSDSIWKKLDLDYLFSQMSNNEYEIL